MMHFPHALLNTTIQNNIPPLCTQHDHMNKDFQVVNTCFQILMHKPSQYHYYGVKMPSKLMSTIQNFCMINHYQDQLLFTD
jgi:hypothetical protein